VEQLRDYAAQRFTSENAVLWLSGPIPEDLQLKLPRGTKHAIPYLAPVQQTLPSWFLDDRCGGVAVGTIVPRVHAATIFFEIASRRLGKHLRSDQALSYAPSVFYDPLDASIAHLVLHADSDQSRRGDLTKIFGEVFQGFGEIDEAEVEAARTQILEHQIGSLAPPASDQMVMEVQRAAMDWIMGKEFEPLEYSAAKYQSVTVDDVTTFVRDLQSTAMFALPSGVPIMPYFGNKTPISTWPVVQGHKAENIDAPIRREELIYGFDGVSFLWADGSHSTVRYSDLAVVLCYEDGGILLVGNDAASVMVEPTLWRDGKYICSKIREQAPAQLVIDQYPRPTDTIPKPTTTAWQRFRASITRN
jgi:hypothetical protein